MNMNHYSFSDPALLFIGALPADNYDFKIFVSKDKKADIHANSYRISCFKNLDKMSIIS